MEKSEPPAEKTPAPAVAVGMEKAAVIDRLGRPDYAAASAEGTLFFYCTYSNREKSRGACTPILFEGGRVVAVGGNASQKWPLATVRFKAEADGVAVTEAKDRPVEPFEETDTITVESLGADKGFTPKPGDRVYVTYHTNFVRYVPLRSDAADTAQVRKTLCIGTGLDVRSVQDDWLKVEGVDAADTGWVRSHWVTGDIAVKIAAEKRRAARAPEIARLEAIVKPIPMANWKENLRLYKRLSALDPCNRHYQRKVDFYTTYGRKAKRGKR